MPAKAEGECSLLRITLPKRFEFMMSRLVKRHQKRNFVGPESRIHGIAEIGKCENEALVPSSSFEMTKSVGQMPCQ